MTSSPEPTVPPFSKETLAKLAQMQQIQFWAVFMEPQDKWDLANAELQNTMFRHIEWLEKMEADGKLVLSGPLGMPDWDGTGMAIMRSESLEAAQSLVETEPFHIFGFRRNRVTSWNVNEGTLLLRVEILSGRGRLS